MNILMRNQLNDAETEKIEALLLSCKKEEDLTLSFPYGDPDTRYLLGFAGSRLLSVLVLCEIDENVFESIAWTDPAFRQKGCFRALWKEAIRLLKTPDEKVRVHFLWDHRSESAGKVIQALKAEKLSDEYQMSLTLSERNPGAGEETEKTRSAYRFSLLREEADGTRRYAVFPGDSRESQPVLTYSVFPGSEKQNGYLFEFAVRKELRGRGLGSALFPVVLTRLSEDGFRSLSLQVSSSNTAAVKIYERAGFRPFITLSYYEILIYS